MLNDTEEIESENTPDLPEDYKYGFSSDVASEIFPKGIDENLLESLQLNEMNLNFF